MEALERRRALYLDGKLEQLSDAEWAMVMAHEAMIEGDDGE